MVTKVKKCNFHVNFPVKDSLGYSNFHNLLEHGSSWKSLSVTSPFTFWRVSIQNILNMNNSSAVFCVASLFGLLQDVYMHIFIYRFKTFSKSVRAALWLQRRIFHWCVWFPQGCLCIQEVDMHFKWCLCVARADKADLQEEAGALRHGGEGRDGRHRR